MLYVSMRFTACASWLTAAKKLIDCWVGNGVVTVVVAAVVSRRDAVSLFPVCALVISWARMGFHTDKSMSSNARMGFHTDESMSSNVDRAILAEYEFEDGDRRRRRQTHSGDERSGSFLAADETPE